MTRWVRLWLVRLWLVMLTVVGLQTTAGVLAPSALACSCAGPSSDSRSVTRADAVFVGELVVREELSGSWGSIGARSAVFTFDVSDVYKGEVREHQSVVTARDGAACGLELRGPGPHLVFARNETPDDDSPDDHPVLLADLCGGSRPLTDGAPDASLGDPHAPTPGSRPDVADGSEGGSSTLLWAGVGGGLAMAVAAGLLLWRRRAAP